MSTPTPLPRTITIIAGVAALLSAYMAMAGILGVLTLVTAVGALIFNGRNRILFLGIALSLLSIALAGAGILMQQQNVNKNCGVPAAVTCFQENYSPWHGVIHALRQ